MSFKPFEFILAPPKGASLEEKLESIRDSIKIIVVNLLRVADYCENKMAEIDEKLSIMQGNFNTLQNKTASLEEKLAKIEPHKENPQTLEGIGPKAIDISNSLGSLPNEPKGNQSVSLVPPPPPQKLRTSFQDVRKSIIEELEQEFKKRGLADASNDS